MYSILTIHLLFISIWVVGAALWARTPPPPSAAPGRHQDRLINLFIIRKKSWPCIINPEKSSSQEQVLAKFICL